MIAPHLGRHARSLGRERSDSVVHFNDRWHVYASSVLTAGAYNMVYTSFADWSEASSATCYYMDQTTGFNTYVAAPQLFYFRPQNKWYLVFQSGPPMYSTDDDPARSDDVDASGAVLRRRRPRSSPKTAAAGWTTG